MTDFAWKAAERAHAADLGVRRIPVTGIDRDGADFTDASCSYQLKVRRALPSWLFGWLNGIVTAAGTSGRIGVLVLNKPRRPRAEALVVLRWSDWLRVRPDAARFTEESPDDDTLHDAAEPPQDAEALNARPGEASQAVADSGGPGIDTHPADVAHGAP